MPSANEYMASFKARHATPKKPRKPAKQQVKEERERALEEILTALRDHKRTIPKDWERGYNSAMSVIERLI